MTCSLCSHTELKKSWLSLEYRRVFEFYECQNCRSLICHPMPDEDLLGQMYSGDYFEAETSNIFDYVHEYLKKQPKGVFLDYGCGSGRFLETVYRAGWTTIGVEFSPETVDKLRAAYPFEIVRVGEQPSQKADIIHLADVLEHLTDLDSQMPEILDLLKPGGLLMAHGPLEGNSNFFQQTMKLSRRLRGGHADIPPYHVTLATTKGQKSLFNRFGLKEMVFHVRQINFPAMDSFKESNSARMKGLYLIRKVSQMLSATENGNHYFYIGRKNHDSE